MEYKDEKTGLAIDYRFDCYNLNRFGSMLDANTELYYRGVGYFSYTDDIIYILKYLIFNGEFYDSFGNNRCNDLVMYIILSCKVDISMLLGTFKDSIPDYSRKYLQKINNKIMISYGNFKDDTKYQKIMKDFSECVKSIMNNKEFVDDINGLSEAGILNFEIGGFEKYYNIFMKSIREKSYSTLNYGSVMSNIGDFLFNTSYYVDKFKVSYYCDKYIRKRLGNK